MIHNFHVHFILNLLPLSSPDVNSIGYYARGLVERGSNRYPHSIVAPTRQPLCMQRKLFQNPSDYCLQSVLAAYRGNLQLAVVSMCDIIYYESRHGYIKLKCKKSYICSSSSCFKACVILFLDSCRTVYFRDNFYYCEFQNI